MNGIDVGSVRYSYCPFYDIHKKKTGFKQRPVLIIGNADADDYVVLPISKVSDKRRVDARYDIPVTLADYPLLGLTYDSYIRTHKQIVINRREFDTSELSNCKSTYPDLFLYALTLVEEFQSKLLGQAI